MTALFWVVSKPRHWGVLIATHISERGLDELSSGRATNYATNPAPPNPVPPKSPARPYGNNPYAVS